MGFISMIINWTIISSCRFSDSIIYLDDGKVIGFGSHSELMKLNKGYASLFNIQASKYQ